MDDIDIRIYRPVALPARFFGAPALPAVFNMAFATLIFLFLLFMDVRINITVLVAAFLGTLIGGHIILIQMGAKDPHLSTLIQTLRFAIRRPRSLGRLKRKEYHP